MLINIHVETFLASATIEHRLLRSCSLIFVTKILISTDDVMLINIHDENSLAHAAVGHELMTSCSLIFMTVVCFTVEV